MARANKRVWLLAVGVFMAAVPAQLSAAEIDQRVATTSTAATARPLIALSFLAGATANGQRLLDRELRNLKPKKTTILKIFVTERPMDHPAQWVIPKTILWVTPLYEQLSRDLGAGSVILNPLIADEDDQGELILKSASDLSGAPVRVYFQAYQYPGLNGTTNTLGPRTEGDQYTPLFLVDAAPTDSNGDISFRHVVSSVPQKAMSSYAQGFVGGKDLEKLLSLGPDNLPKLDKVTRKAASDIIKSAQPMIARDTASSHVARYAKLAGLNGLEIAPKFLEAETDFRANRSRKLATYIWNSKLGDSLQDLLRAEKKGQGSLDLAWMTAGIGGLQGSGTSMMDSLLRAQPGMSQSGQTMAEAVFPVLSQQVKVSSASYAEFGVVEAASIGGLREKFRAIERRRTPPR